MNQEAPQNELLPALAALASPHRLAIVAQLHGGRMHVSGLARAVGLSRPLVHMHVAKLEAAGLVTGSLELSDDGKALRYLEVTEFALQLSPASIAAAQPQRDDLPVRRPKEQP